MTTQDEVFPNAPLALVAMEVRFPAAAPGPLRLPVLRAMKEFLGKGWVIEGAKQQTVSVEIPVDGRPPSSNVTTEELSKLTVRDRTRVITVRPEALTLEATRYDGYNNFKPLLLTAFEAVERVLMPEGVVRLGLRYIDEIQVTSMPVDWGEWVHPSLLAPHAAGLTANSWTGAVQYAAADDRKLVLRYGPSDLPVVNQGGALKPTRPSKPGPVFVLDFDSFWEPKDIPAFEPAILASTCDDLRTPVRQLFDQLSTPQLLNVYREEVST